MEKAIVEKIIGLVKDDGRFHQKTGNNSLYEQFISEYPKERLSSLTLEDYCLGYGSKESNFCWWLERGLVSAFGRYSPGTAKGHLIFRNRDGTYYKHRRLSELTDDEAIEYVAKIHYTIASITENEYLWLDNRDEIYRRAGVDRGVIMGPGRLMRLVQMYQPEHMPSISSLDHIKHFLNVLGEEDIPGSPVRCIERLRSHFQFIKQEAPLLTMHGLCSALYSDALGVQPPPRSSKRQSVNGESEEERVDVGDTAESVLAKNQILYGPPGTGKTFDTKERAVKLAEPEWFSDIEDQDLEPSELRMNITEKYSSLESEGRIVFSTIHQSYSYEDFVEGIRAKTDNGVVQYEIEDGIFKSIAAAATSSVNQALQRDVSTVEIGDRKIWKMSLGDTNKGEDSVFHECVDRNYIALGYGENHDFTGCNSPEEITNKLHSVDPQLLDKSNFAVTAINIFKNKINVSDLIVVTEGNQKFRAIGEVTGDYELLIDDPLGHFYQARSVKWHRVYDPGMPSDALFSKSISQMTLYNLKPKTLNMDRLAEILGDNSEKSLQYVLVLDEINRGNISRIFGELITLLEPDKRLNGKDQRQVLLPYSKKPFIVPGNLHVIGTMNTADKSLASIDLALRRRFDFIEVMPDSELLEGVSVYGIDLGKLLSVINSRIEVLLDRDHLIGHAYFWPILQSADSVTREKQLANIFSHKIIPLLQEYFYSDWERIRWVLNDNSKPAKSQFVRVYAAKPKLDDLFPAEVVGQVADRRFRVNEAAFHDANAYQLIFLNEENTGSVNDSA